MRWRPLRTAAFASAILVIAGAAHATEPDATTRAREAYDRGVRAHAAGDHPAAARAFAEADAIAPTSASLEAALESAMRADDPVLGAELVDREKGRATDASLQKTLGTARRRFAGRAGRIVVECNDAKPCIVSVDGVASDASRAVYARAGAHDVIVQRGEERFQRLVQVKADETNAVTGPRAVQVEPWTAEPKPSRPREGGGLPVQWFYAGLVATAVAGGLTVASGLDTIGLHDRLEESGCLPGATGSRPSSCDDDARAGKSAQLRTNVLLGVTGVFAAATVVTLFFVKSSPSGTSARLAVSPSWAGLEIRTP